LSLTIRFHDENSRRKPSRRRKLAYAKESSQTDGENRF